MDVLVGGAHPRIKPCVDISLLFSLRSLRARKDDAARFTGILRRECEDEDEERVSRFVDCLLTRRLLRRTRFSSTYLFASEHGQFQEKHVYRRNNVTR